MINRKSLRILRTPMQYQTQHTVWYDLCILAFK